ncbi:triacylglycerol lipase [Ancylostoma ceylanicum]|uniref:Triacylglycerol lipase n=1 Tax=Ancylostoma ceylanicum TaxID=53326 RepID=A0A0D6M823_9BILA|nr:triacylglycerol lipase [Ancylostoma ceylanicum]
MLDSASGNTSEEEERLDFYEYSDHFARKMMLTISAAAYSDDPQQCLSHILGRVTLWAHMEHKFKEFLREHPDWDIWISGHSLGGALATLAASNIVESRIAEDPDKVKLVTLGQPRVGDKDFAEALDDQVEYSYRIVHWMDVVPSLPKTGYWHQGEEIFYKAGMEPHESSSCGRGDSVYCSAQYLPTSINDHKTYFGKHREESCLPKASPFCNVDALGQAEYSMKMFHSLQKYRMTPLFVAFLFVPAAANDDSSEDVKRYGYFFEYNDAFARKIMGTQKTGQLVEQILDALLSPWISGHSLGGALATLAASNLVQLRVLANADKVKLVTFGQPRVGDQAFAKAVDDQIFYASDMSHENSHECGRGDSICCSNARWSTSISDHREYFGKSVSAYGKGGCKP